jgi:hypothetical protein
MLRQSIRCDFGSNCWPPQAQGRSHAALATIAEALTLGEPRGFFRTFVDLGAPMATLLGLYMEETDGSPLAVRLIDAIGASGTSCRWRAGAPQRSLDDRPVGHQLVRALGSSRRHVCVTVVATLHILAVR